METEVQRRKLYSIFVTPFLFLSLRLIDFLTFPFTPTRSEVRVSQEVAITPKYTSLSSLYFLLDPRLVKRGSL